MSPRAVIHSSQVSLPMIRCTCKLEHRDVQSPVQTNVKERHLAKDGTYEPCTPPTRDKSGGCSLSLCVSRSRSRSRRRFQLIVSAAQRSPVQWCALRPRPPHPPPQLAHTHLTHLTPRRQTTDLTLVISQLLSSSYTWTSTQIPSLAQVHLLRSTG